MVKDTVERVSHLHVNNPCTSRTLLVFDVFSNDRPLPAISHNVEEKKAFLQRSENLLRWDVTYLNKVIIIYSIEKK